MVSERHYKPKVVKGDSAVLHVPIIIIYVYKLVNNIHFFSTVTVSRYIFWHVNTKCSKITFSYTTQFDVSLKKLLNSFAFGLNREKQTILITFNAKVLH